MNLSLYLQLTFLFCFGKTSIYDEVQLFKDSS